MPRPNPPRKRPRRRPDAVERSARAEVSLAKQTAQVKGNNGSADGKRQSSAKAQPATKGGAGARGRRIDEPFVPWQKRSYLVLVAVLFVAELMIGGFYYLTIQSSKPPPPPFDIFLLAVSYQPLLPVAAALVAAPIAKLITKESRSLRFMESLIVGIVQYFVWLSLFVALTYIIGGFNSATTTASATSATTTEIIGLVVIDILSYVAAYYAYPPLYKFMRRRPPPRTAKPGNAKPAAAPQGRASVVDKMDEASARDAGAKGPSA